MGSKHHTSSGEVSGKKKRRESTIALERARAVPFLGAMDGNEKAKGLDMDHIFIRYLDFLWGFIYSSGPWLLLGAERRIYFANSSLSH